MANSLNLLNALNVLNGKENNMSKIEKDKLKALFTKLEKDIRATRPIELEEFYHRMLDNFDRFFVWLEKNERKEEGK